MDEIERLLNKIQKGLFEYHPDYEYKFDTYKSDIKHLIELVENEQVMRCRRMMPNKWNTDVISSDNLEMVDGLISESPRVSQTIDWKEL